MLKTDEIGTIDFERRINIFFFTLSFSEHRVRTTNHVKNTKCVFT